MDFNSKDIVWLFMLSVNIYVSSERIIHCAWTPNNEIEVNRITLLVGTIDHLKNLKNQALQGFLVNALAHRGDERRDTLR